MKADIHDLWPRAPRNVVITLGTERNETIAFFRWAKSMFPFFPQLRLLYAIPNGLKREGTRSEVGTRAGVPDIHFPVRSGDFSSLYIEMKVNDGDTSLEQNAWLRELHNAGNAVCVAYGWMQAASFILEYILEPEDFVSGP